MVAQVAVNDIKFCNEERCAGVCGGDSDLCESGLIGCDAVAASSADVVYTTNKGVTWTNTAAQPFAADENIISVTCFRKDKDTTRWIVARDVDLANPMEIAYSDDSGATWTLVDVGTTNGLYANDSGALFALDYRHIWLVLTDGYIYFSSDGGVTWTAQDSATVTAQDYNAVHFASQNIGYAVADAGIVAKTSDGGATWTAATAITGVPNVLCVYVFDDNNVVVGDANGVIWRSFDGGVTWTAIFTGATAINDISFANDFVGFAIDGDDLYRTRNGGEDWESVSIAAGTEYNALWVCDSNQAYVVGEDAANEGVVFKVTAY